MNKLFSLTDVSFRKLIALVQKKINSKQDTIKGTPGNVLTFDQSGNLTELDRGSIKGSDGVSVTSVDQIASSTADGGINTFRITLSNGNTADFSVRNGSKGSTGERGATGATGPKGDKGDNATTTAVASTTANGLMSASMVTKLNGIEAGANKAVEMSDATIESIFNSVFPA